MGSLYKYHLFRVMRNKGDMFFSLLFPLILGALFYLSFGTSGTETMMSPITTALIRQGNASFETFLEEMDGDALNLVEMTDDEAQKALKDGSIDGIFYSSEEPSLAVSTVQLNTSILSLLLDTYTENQTMLETIAVTHPEKLPDAISAITDQKEFVSAVDMSGNSTNDTLTYYFALVSMACLFGSFSGSSVSSQLRADQSALAARRSISPTHRFKMVFSELAAVFTIQFFNQMVLLIYLHFILGIDFGEKWYLLIPVCILGSITGVSEGIFLGCLHLSEGIKSGLMVGSSLVMCFLSDLMVGGIRNSIEHHLPLLNRINPAALISDAFYCITVYDNPARYRRNLLLLACITIILVFVTYRMLRRERYDSL